MFPSDSLPPEIRFRQAYTLSLYLLVMGRVSPVPNHTFHTYRSPYTEGFFRADSSIYTRSMVFAHMPEAQLPFSLFRDLFNDTAEFTLCYGLHDCSHLLSRLLYPLA